MLFLGRDSRRQPIRFAPGAVRWQRPSVEPAPTSTIAGQVTEFFCRPRRRCSAAKIRSPRTARPLRCRTEFSEPLPSFPYRVLRLVESLSLARTRLRGAHTSARRAPHLHTAAGRVVFLFKSADTSRRVSAPICIRVRREGAGLGSRRWARLAVVVKPPPPPGQSCARRAAART